MTNNSAIDAGRFSQFLLEHPSSPESVVVEPNVFEFADLNTFCNILSDLCIGGNFALASNIFNNYREFYGLVEVYYCERNLPACDGLYLAITKPEVLHNVDPNMILDGRYYSHVLYPFDETTKNGIKLIESEIRLENAYVVGKIYRVGIFDRKV